MLQQPAQIELASQGVGSLKGIGRATALLFAREGVKALYLMDYDGTNLPDLESAVKKIAPKCSVGFRGFTRLETSLTVNTLQVVTMEADAADESKISGVCDRAIKEHGKLDVFFANAGQCPRL